MTMQRCTVPEEKIAALVAGDLRGQQELELTAHLAECPICLERATGFAGMESALAALGPSDVVRWHTFESPFGRMFLSATSRGLSRVSWQQASADTFVQGLTDRYRGLPVIEDRDALGEAEEQVREYFAGDRSGFDFPVDLAGVGSFDRRVLVATAEIPFGQVIGYGEVARRIGSPGAARAVGNALGRNPVAIVVPCHRVVRSDGSLGGYTGGSEYKERLLAIEGQPRLFV